MKVVLVVRRFPQRSETFIVSHFLGLLSRGLDVHVLCEQRNIALWSSFPELDGLEDRIHESAAPTTVRWEVLRSSLRAMAQLVCSPRGVARLVAATGDGRSLAMRAVQVLRLAPLLRLQPDLVHFEFGVLGREHVHAVRALGPATIVSFRGYDLAYAGLEDPNFYRQVWERADGIHFLGDGVRRRAYARGFDGRSLYRLIAPSIDLGRFRRPEREITSVGTADRPLRLLSVGRLVWEKGYEHAVGAIRMLVDDGWNVEYRIVGEGPHLDAVAFGVHQLGLGGCVDLVGTRDHASVVEELLRADIFVHAAVSEGFGNVVMEAQAMELPVVCSDAGGLPENVSNGDTGLVVPRRDPRRMADAIARLASDATLRAAMGRAGRQRVTERFDLAAQIDAFLELYDAALT